MLGFGRCVVRRWISLYLLAGLLVGLGAATAAASTYSDSVLADSPRGYWRFGELPGATTVVDASGNANNGTYAGGVTLGLPGAIVGDANTAASFDGVNDSASIPSSPSLSTSSIFTVEGWIRRSSTTKSHQMMVKGNAFQLVVMNAGSGNQVWLRKANVTTLARSNGGIPADGAYHHVAATMNGAGSSVMIYIDGVADTVIVSSPQTIPDTTYPIVLGTTASNEARYDEFAFYAQPLSATRIQQHKTAGTAQPNVAPVVTASGGPTAYSEGGAAVTVDGALTVTDTDDTNLESLQVRISTGYGAGDVLTFTPGPLSGSYVAGTGVLTLTGSASVATYQTVLRSVGFSSTNDNPATSKTIEFKVNDGSVDSNLATKAINVTPVNDPAVVLTTAGALAYTEGAAATAVDGALTVSDPDDTSLTGATVQITGGLQSADELLFSNAFGVSNGGYVAATGLLTLTGTATLANYQSALRSVQYRHTGDDPSTSKTVSFRADDGDGLGPAGTRSITVTPVNDKPVVTTSMGSASFNAGGAAVVVDPGILVSDADSANLSGAVVHVASSLVEDELAFTSQFGITGSYDGGTGDLTLMGSATVANYQTVLRSVTYDNAHPTPANASRTVSFKVTDSSGAVSDAASRNVTITTPVNGAPVVTTTMGSTAYTENAAGVTVDGSLTVTDSDDANLESLRVRISVGFESGDTLTFAPGPLSGSYNAGTGVLTLTGSALVATYQTVLRSVAFSSTNDAPVASKTIEFKVNDGDVDSNLATKPIAITAVNDAPTVTTTATALGYTAGSGAVAADPGLLLTDPDSATIAGATVTIQAPNFNSAQDTLALPMTAGLMGTFSSATGVLTLTPTMGPLAINTLRDALRTVTYANSSASPTPLSRTIAFQVNDGAAANNLSNVATRAITITGAANQNPVADDETFSGADAAIGNTALIVDDPSDGAPTVTGPKKTITGDILAGDTDADGPGPLVVVDGTFATSDGGSVVLQADGDFTFKPAATTSCSDLSDSFDYTVSDQNVPTAGTDTATVTIAITGCVWYVNNNDPGNAGTSTAPFDTLAQAQSSSVAGDTIFVFKGSGTTGYDAGIDLKDNQRLIGEAANLQIGSDLLHTGVPANRPTITDSNADVVNLASGNTVRGVQIDPLGTGGGIAGDAADNSGTIDDVKILDAGTAGTQPGLELSSTSGTWTVSALEVSSGFGGVSLSNTGGTTTFGDLALTTTGATAAFALSNAAGVTVTASATANVSATGGPAVAVNGAAGATLAFDDVDSTNSATTGVSLTGLGVGTFSANASSLISSATGIDFDLNGGSGAVTYDGAITDDVGQLVRVQNTTGGTKDFNGPISDGNDGDGSGIALTSNPGATIRFDGGLTLSTGANPAFAATGGGSVAVTDPAGTPANTIVTTTGTALNVSNTAIASSAMTFESISAGTSSSGPTNGILLANTGSLGGLTVTGAAGTCASAASCSGGAIQQASGTAILMANVGATVSLSHMEISSAGTDGINTLNSAGVQLASSRVLDNGDAAGERGLDYVDSAGSSTISDTLVTGSADDNLSFFNSNASPYAVSLDVTGSTFSSNSTTLGGAGAQLTFLTTGSADVSITGSTFTANRNSGIQISAASGAPTINAHLNSNTVTGGNAGATPFEYGIRVRTSNEGHANVEVDDNAISGTVASALLVDSPPDSTADARLDATITNNTIGDGTAFSGSSQGMGLMLTTAGSTTGRFAVRGNLIRNYAAWGMYLYTSSTSGDGAYTVTQNTISDSSATAFTGVTVLSGAGSADTPLMCVDIGGAGLENNLGAAGPSGQADVHFTRNTAAVLRLPGFTTGGNLQAYLAGRNTGSPTVDVDPSYAPTGQVGGCDLPAPPPP